MRSGVQWGAPFAHDNVLAVRDAAFTVDPLSGQGLIEAMTGASHAVAAVASGLGGAAAAVSHYHERCYCRLQSHLQQALLASEVAAEHHRGGYWERRCNVLRALLALVGSWLAGAEVTTAPHPR